MKPKTINVILCLIFVIILSVLYIPQIIEWCKRIEVYSQPLSAFRWELYYDGSEYNRDYNKYGEHVPIQFLEPYCTFYGLPEGEILCSPVNFGKISKSLTETLLKDTFSLGWYDYRGDKFRLLKIPLEELKLKGKDKPLKPYKSYGVELNSYFVFFIQTDGTVKYLLHDTYSSRKITVFPSEEVNMDWKTFMPDNKYNRQEWRDIVMLIYPWVVKVSLHFETDEYDYASSLEAKSISGITYSSNDIYRGAKSIPEYIDVKRKGLNIRVNLDLDETLDAFRKIYAGYEGNDDELPKSEFIISNMRESDSIRIFLRVIDGEIVKLGKAKIRKE